MELSAHGHGRILLAGSVRPFGRLLYSWQFFNALCLASSKATGIKPDSARTCQDMAIIGNGCFAASMRLRPQNVPFAFGLHLLIRLPGIPPSSITTIPPRPPPSTVTFDLLQTIGNIIHQRAFVFVLSLLVIPFRWANPSSL